MNNFLFLFHITAAVWGYTGVELTVEIRKASETGSSWSRGSIGEVTRQDKSKGIGMHCKNSRYVPDVTRQFLFLGDVLWMDLRAKKASRFLGVSGKAYGVSGKFLESFAQALQTTDTWTRYTVLDGFQPPPGAVMKARSRIQCGIFCNSSDTCQSFFFTTGDMVSNCHLHMGVYLNSMGMIPQPNATYYIPVNYSVPTFVCFPNDNLYHTVLLSDYTYFTYKFHQTYASYGESMNICVNGTGQLVKITTQAKLDMLRNLLLCADFVPTNTVYFVDGVYDTNNSTFRFNEGNIATFPNTFWGEFQPSNPTVNDCSGLGEGVSWFGRSVKCSQTATFICELV